MQASLARMVADARRHLRRGSLCRCGGGAGAGGMAGGAVGNPTVWDDGEDSRRRKAGTAGKAAKGGLVLGPVAALATPLPPFLPPLDAGLPDDVRRKNGTASQCHHPSLRIPAPVTEDEATPRRRGTATAVRRDSFSEALKPLVMVSEVRSVFRNPELLRHETF